MTVTISKWGNSQGFRVPKEYSIDELVNNLPKDYKASEEFSSKSGSEIW